MSTEAQRERALRLAHRLLEAIPEDIDEGVLLRTQQVIDRLTTPMAMVLEKVPGGSISEKCEKIGITRQNYYCWMKGQYRPNLDQSKRLARLTGLKVEQIYWKEL
jgi:hypothetical protein